MKALNKGINLLDTRWIMPVSGGMVIALASAFILRMSLIWAGLITVGLAVGILSLTAKNFKTYWLAIYALVLPLGIKKVLVDTEYLRSITLQHGQPVGELPAPILYLWDLPFLVLMAIWIFDIVYRKQKVIFPKSNWIALAFISWAVLSSINSTALIYTFFDLLKWIKLYILYLYIANNIQTRETIRVLVFFLLIGVIVQALFCLYQYLSQDIAPIFGTLFGKDDFFTDEGALKLKGIFSVSEASSIMKRASGTIGHSNSQARYFEFLLPIAFMLFIKSTRLRSRVFNLMLLVLGMMGLIVTFSRGGFIGMSVGLTAVVLLARWVRLISGRQFIAIILIGAIIGIVSAPFTVNHMLTRPESTSARFGLYKIGLNMIKDNPVLGGGLNHHMMLKSKFDLTMHGSYFYPVHNYYLVIASEIGIPGLIFFLGFLARTLMLAFSAARSNDPYLASLAVGIFSALTAVSIHALVDVIGNNIIFSFLWLFAGLAASLNTISLAPSAAPAVNENRLPSAASL
jgi:hypothetical protein